MKKSATNKKNNPHFIRNFESLKKKKYNVKKACNINNKSCKTYQRQKDKFI